MKAQGSHKQIKQAGKAKKGARAYEIMHKRGKKGFGSDCRHEKVKNGYCMNCLRRVI